MTLSLVALVDMAQFLREKRDGGRMGSVAVELTVVTGSKSMRGVPMVLGLILIHVFVLCRTTDSRLHVTSETHDLDNSPQKGHRG